MSRQPTPPDRVVPATSKPWLRGVLFIYRQMLSPILHATHRSLTGSAGACRFQPTCSEYASLAVHMHGARRGGLLALARFLRCHPFARGGFDPVPQVDHAVAPAVPMPDATHAGKPAASLAPSKTASHLP